MKKFFAYILILGIIIQVSGQNSNILIWKKDTLSLYSNPLDSRTDWQRIDQSITEQIHEYEFNARQDSSHKCNFWLNNN